MKPFNVEAAKSGAKVVTRDGHEVRIICFDAKSSCPIISLVIDDDGVESIFTYLSRGSFLVDGEISGLDLVMAPVKKEGWMNVYPDFINTVYTTKALANKESAFNRTDCVKVEWEE